MEDCCWDGNFRNEHCSRERQSFKGTRSCSPVWQETKGIVSSSPEKNIFIQILESISKIFSGGQKGQNHSELQTKNKEKQIKCATFLVCSRDRNVSWWKGRQTHNPLEEAEGLCVFLWSSSSTTLHFTSTGSAVCQLSPPQTGLLTMWHTADVPSSHYAVVRPSPWQSRHPPHTTKSFLRSKPIKALLYF